VFNCFKKDYVKPTEEPPLEGDDSSTRRKTGLLIGHSFNDKGASNSEWYVKNVEYDPTYDEYVKEYDMDGDRVLEEYELNLKAATISTLTYATRDDGRGRRGACEELAEADCTEIVSMHCNSYNGGARGFEVWYLDGVIESKRFAQKFYDAFMEQFPETIGRGLKKGHKRSRAYGVLDAGRDYGIRKTILVEYYFLDVRADFIPPEEIGKFLRKFGSKG